jgi:predicted RNA binding protein YcfA (HicA-like mRNA interferase family)
MGKKYPILNGRKLDKRLREIGCKFLRQSGSHRHYSNPFHPDKLITFPVHPGDVPKGIVEDIIDDLGLTKDDFFFKKFK